MNNKKILIVDDNAVIIKTLSMKLQSKGYIVASAVDGARAASAIRSNKPDLIVLDINFPQETVTGPTWDGFSIIEWIHRIEGTQNIPIIIITGDDPTIYKERLLTAGALAFFRKPINNDELLETIQKIFSKQA